MSENLTRDAFAEQLNTKFDIYLAPENVVAAKLSEVTELRKMPHNEIFSIFLHAPVDVPFGQNIYKIEHSVLGSFELFLVPVGKDEEGVKYEAVFNRLVE